MKDIGALVTKPAQVGDLVTKPAQELTALVGRDMVEILECLTDLLTQFIGCPHLCLLFSDLCLQLIDGQSIRKSLGTMVALKTVCGMASQDGRAIECRQSWESSSSLGVGIHRKRAKRKGL